MFVAVCLLRAKGRASKLLRSLTVRGASVQKNVAGVCARAFLVYPAHLTVTHVANPLTPFATDLLCGSHHTTRTLLGYPVTAPVSHSVTDTPTREIILDIFLQVREN